MKKLLLTIAAVAAIALPALSQVNPIYSSQTLAAFSCNATAGTNVGLVLDVRKQKSVDLQIELMADASGAYTFTVPYTYSVDGVVYATNNPGSIAISFNGVTKQVVCTNILTYDAGYIRIPHLTNATAAINVTNGVIKYGLKAAP